MQCCCVNLAKNCFIYLGVKIVFLALVTTVAGDMFLVGLSQCFEDFRFYFESWALVQSVLLQLLFFWFTDERQKDTQHGFVKVRECFGK